MLCLGLSWVRYVPLDRSLCVFSDCISKADIISGRLRVAVGSVRSGSYLLVEAISCFTGSEYSVTAMDIHVGYEGTNWYVQAGPVLLAPDAGDGDVELSGKAGGSYPVSEALSVYGEVSFVTGEDENGYGTKVGAKYNF